MNIVKDEEFEKLNKDRYISEKILLEKSIQYKDEEIKI